MKCKLLVGLGLLNASWPLALIFEWVVSRPHSGIGWYFYLFFSQPLSSVANNLRFSDLYIGTFGMNEKCKP